MKRKPESIRNKLLPAAAFCLILLLWWIISATGLVPSYMLPSPVSVAAAFIKDFPNLMTHALVSLQEAIYGLIIGVVLAFIIASLMDRFETLEKALLPLLVVTQTIPTIAIAPLLVLWMGFGMAPKITLVVVTTFFPIAVGMLDGYKSVDPDEINLLRSMKANRLQIFRHVKIPAALPYFFSGLRVSASYAVVGAVISEWLGGFEGLGVYMTRVRKAYAFDKMFAVIILIIIVSLFLMALVDLIKKVSMPWLSVTQSNNNGADLHEKV
ncbi:MAG: ABC transporter permease [Anaerolineaceae bacterium]|nr:ABC transporter permease [Anaerolineaceae bacterium]